jgi:hypothetical protein
MIFPTTERLGQETTGMAGSSGANQIHAEELYDSTSEARFATAAAAAAAAARHIATQPRESELLLVVLMACDSTMGHGP